VPQRELRLLVAAKCVKHFSAERCGLLFDKLIGKRSVDGGVLACCAVMCSSERDIGGFYVSVEYIAIAGNGDGG
jgi:hypothetical protein